MFRVVSVILTLEGETCFDGNRFTKMLAFPLHRNPPHLGFFVAGSVFVGVMHGASLWWRARRGFPGFGSGSGVSFRDSEKSRSRFCRLSDRSDRSDSSDKSDGDASGVEGERTGRGIL